MAIIRHLFVQSSIAVPFLSSHIIAHVITPLARLPEPTPILGGVSPNELFGEKGGFLAKRAFEDVTDCDGAGVLTCGGGTQYCYSGINNYLGCCDKGTTCLARTTCVPYPDVSTANCDHNTGGCVLCTNSELPSCFTLGNAGGQFGLYCSNVEASSSITVTKQDNPAMSTGVAIGTPAASTDPSTDPSTDSTPASTGASSTGGPAPTSSTTPDDSSSGGISTGAIAGIAVGGVIVAIIIAFLIWHFGFRKRGSKNGAAYGPPGEDIPGPGLESHEAKPYNGAAAALGGVSSSNKPKQSPSGAPWNPESYAYGHYQPGPEGAELDSGNVIPQRSPAMGTVSSFEGSPLTDQNRSTMGNNVSPLIGYGHQNQQAAAKRASIEPREGAAFLDGSEINEVPAHRRDASNELPATNEKTFTALRPNPVNRDGVSASERPVSQFPSYLTPENALGGGYERDEARLRDETARSGGQS